MEKDKYKLKYIPYEKIKIQLKLDKFDAYMQLKEIIETNFRRKNTLLIDTTPRDKNFYGSVTPDNFDAQPHFSRQNPAKTELDGTIKQKKGYTELIITQKISDFGIAVMSIWLAAALFGAIIGIIGEFIKGNYFYPIFFLLVPILPYVIIIHNYNVFSRRFKNDLYTLFEDDIVRDSDDSWNM